MFYSFSHDDTENASGSGPLTIADLQTILTDVWDAAKQPIPPFFLPNPESPREALASHLDDIYGADRGIWPIVLWPEVLAECDI